jgi:hypothetical protein
MFALPVLLLIGAEKDRLHHSFNPGSHLLSGDAAGSLKPTGRGPEDGPGGRHRQQSCIDSACFDMLDVVYQGERALVDLD